MSRKQVLVGVTVLVVIAVLARHLFLGASFNADRIAASETRMWQCYYSGGYERQGRELVMLLREQFGLSSRDAIAIGTLLAGAAATFRGLDGNYETRVLPTLEQAYARLKASTGGTWDAAAAAKAELDWWVARRTPGRDSAEEVGRAIARLYGILYGKSNASIAKAGLLRAQAAAVRDSGGEKCDWGEVERLLRESYRSLVRGISR